MNKMKVLWFTNTPSNYRVRKSGGYGGEGWVSSLENEIRKVDSIELAVSFLMPGQPFKECDGRVTYYPVSLKRTKNKYLNKVCDIVYLCTSSNDIEEWKRHEEAYLKVINDYKPDIIQIFGSEGSFALVASCTKVPVVLHIQGLLTPCLTAYLPPFVSWHTYLRSAKNPFRILSKWIEKKNWERHANREQEMIRRVKYFFGRTDWDERVIEVINPNAQYIYGGEILRPAFYEVSQRVLPKRFTIVTTISQPLYKGFDIVLKTAYWMKKYLYMDFEWRVYGNVNPKVMEKMLKLKHQNLGISIMGVASQNELRKSMLQASVYVHSSYIDNSPNSLCEAQILGLPVVATNVGGIPSLIKEGETGYLVPSNDPFQMAYRLYRLSLDNDLNRTMGEKGKSVALQRHDKTDIVNKLLSDYNNIIHSMIL